MNSPEQSGPKPSAVIAKIQDSVPEKEEAEIRNLIIENVRLATNVQGREPSITVYKEVLGAYELLAQKSSSLLRKMVLEAFVQQEYGRILGPEKYLAINKIIAEKIDTSKVVPLIEGYMDSRISEETEETEYLFIMQEAVYSAVSQLAQEAFSEAEIAEVIDDEVLRSEMCSHISKQAASLMTSIIGISLDEMMTEEDEQQDMVDRIIDIARSRVTPPKGEA